MRRFGGVLLACAACALISQPLAAQVWHNLGGGAAAALLRFRSTTPFGGEAMSGPAAGAQARMVIGPVAFEGSYLQGRLSPDTGSAPARDVADASLFLVARPAGWLALKAGPHLRSYITPGGTERWMTWEGRARLSAELVPGLLRTYVEAWVAASADVNVGSGASGAQGGEAGLSLYPARSPLWVRLGYGFDQAKMKGNARTETLETLMLAVGLGGR